MLSFLTRYPSALLIFPVMFYTLINRKSVEIKDIILGISSSLLLLIPVLIFFYEVFGNPFYSFLNFFGSSSATVSTNYSAYNPDTLYFINNLALFIGDQLVAIIFIIMLCFGVYILLKAKKGFQFKIRLFNAPYLDKIMVMKLILLITLILSFVGTFGKLYYMLSEILFFTLAYVLYDLVKNLNMKNMDMHLLVFAWFMAFFIFHSVYAVKDYRYFVTMAPAVVYFLILCINQIYSKLEFKIRNINMTSYLFSIILIIIIISSTMSCLFSVQESNNNLRIIDKNMNSSSQWIINYDPTYKNKIIYSDLWPYSGWYLKMNVGMMPLFRLSVIGS
jgi:hypothetical protein